MPADEAEVCDFNIIFKTHCIDQRFAEQFLTPELRRRIVEAGRHCGGKLSIVLERDGCIFIAAEDENQELSETTDLDQLRSRLRTDISCPLKVLDCFLDISSEKA